MSQASARAEVESIVSAVAWATVPGLRRAVENWAELAGDEGSGTIVSAVRFDLEWVSVRVSATGEPAKGGRWVEWLIPVRFRQASQAALDHFAAHELRRATASLRGRDTPERSLTVPDVLTLFPLTLSEIGAPMPAKPIKPDDGRGVPAPASPARSKAKSKPAEATPPAPAKSKPGPKPKTAEARSNPGPKPSKVAATSPSTARSKPKPKAKSKPGTRAR